MSINLKKGQKINLRKEDGNTLKHIIVGLGWDEVERKSSFFKRPQEIDCDASAFLCINGKVQTVDDVVYYGNLVHDSKAVRHMGDNTTGEGDGDDEQISIDLTSLPIQYDRIIIVVNIYDAYSRNQNFGLIRNAYARVVDSDTFKEICKFDLTENYDGYTAMICGELVRDHGEWVFNAIGKPTNDGKLGDLLARYE